MENESVIGPDRIRAFTWEPGDLKAIPIETLRPATMTLCFSCLWRESGAAKCRAFPDGIPDGFWGTGGYEAQQEHRAAYPGDRGYRYAPRASEE